MNFKEKVNNALYDIEELLLRKNKSYGNSALEPLRIFSEANSTEQLKVRIDDKLSRINNLGLDKGTVDDLIGYLILLKIAIDEKSKE